ncbi:MAG: SH3 domain-containing protein [Saprospiraceae bacterium]|nr:SH3 domain-containing protein [Saprospiraceae bacterium]
MRTMLFWAGLLCFFACQTEQKPVPAPASVPADDVKTAHPYRAGDVLHAHARAGLTLRRSAGPDAEKVGSIPYAQSVTVVALPEGGAPYVAEAIGPYAVSGYWPKVRTSDGKEGYVFDGYLSVYPTLKEDPEDGMDYGDAFYGLVSKRRGGRQKLIEQEPGLMFEHSYSQAFENGSVYTSKFYEGGATYVFETPKGAHRMAELLVLLRSFYYPEAVNTKWDEAEKAVLVTPVEEGYSFLKIRETADGGLRAEFAVAD